MIKGVGLGLRHELMNDLCNGVLPSIDFLEFAPENWLGVGGRRHKNLRALLEKYPAVCHGLSLSLGSPAPLDESFIQSLKDFMAERSIAHYSEHLSYCSDTYGQLYELLPIPFTEEAVHYVADRIKRVQDLLERRIAIENISYYCPLATALSESEFINAVLTEADCDLLLDINNIYVNSVNHGYDATAFLAGMPAERIAYVHIAGHEKRGGALLVDTHGMTVADAVWQLLEQTYRCFGVLPTLLERDNNINGVDKIADEIDRIRRLQHNAEK